MKRFTAAVAALAFVAACSEGPTGADVLEAPSAPSLSAGGNSGPSAMGSGHFEIGDDLRTFAFTAITGSDGTVKGQAQLYNRAQDARSHLEIDCLRVVGNVAYVSGVITRSTLVGSEGTKAYFTVQDNGEGNDAAPDLVSLVTYSPNFPDNLCSFDLPLPTEAVSGNIQVRP